MKKLKFAIPFLLMIALVLVGVGCLPLSQEKFYKKVCKVGIPLKEELEDIEKGWGVMVFEEDYDEDDIDDCIDDLIDTEEDLREECEDEEDEEVCDEVIENYREAMGRMFTRDGCKTMYSFMCQGYAATGDYDEINECFEDIEKACNTLPRSF